MVRQVQAHKDEHDIREVGVMGELKRYTAQSAVGSVRFDEDEGGMWCLYSHAAAEIGRLKEKVEALKGECDHRDESVAAFRARVRERDNEIVGLKEAATCLQDDRDALAERVSRLEAKP